MVGADAAFTFTSHRILYREQHILCEIVWKAEHAPVKALYATSFPNEVKPMSAIA